MREQKIIVEGLLVEAACVYSGSLLKGDLWDCNFLCCVAALGMLKSACITRIFPVLDWILFKIIKVCIVCLCFLFASICSQNSFILCKIFACFGARIDAYRRVRVRDY